MTYRVWMKDGYAGLYNADSPEQAKAQAVAAAKQAAKGAAMTAREYRQTVTVARVERL